MPETWSFKVCCIHFFQVSKPDFSVNVFVWKSFSWRFQWSVVLLTAPLQNYCVCLKYVCLFLSFINRPLLNEDIFNAIEGLAKQSRLFLYSITYMCVFLFNSTPLFSKEKIHVHEYDVPLDRAGNCREPHVFSFLFVPLSLWVMTPNVRDIHSRWKE